MKKLSIIASCLILMAGLSFGQTSFSLVQQGTNNTSLSINGSTGGTFILTLNANVAGYLAAGYSLWLQAQTLNNFSNSLSITSFTGFQWTDKNQPGVPKVFDSPIGADAGFAADRQGTFSGDLGFTANDPSTEGFTGTAHLADYTFNLAAGVAPGVYILKSTSLSPKQSGINDDQFAFHTAPQVLFTITVTGIPEPGTLSLFGLGTLGSIGLTWLRARRK